MLKAVGLTTENLVNPIGIDEPSPQFCWKLVSDHQNTIQKSYRIVVMKQASIFWDSGEVAGSQSLYIEYGGKTLRPYTAYSWGVSVTDHNGETAKSDTAFFETGRMGLPWRAGWITTDGKLDDDSTTPTHIYKKVFAISKEVAAARLYISALGVYSCRIGGRQASEAFFTPGYTDYLRHVQYQTYDVTGLLAYGENPLQCEVAGGWYTGRLGFVLKGNQYGKKRALILELRIRYRDGSEETVVSDESFRYTCDGPRRFAGFFDGEVYDANREDPSKWQWHNARFLKAKTPAIVPDISVPVIKHDEIRPVSSHTVEGGIIYNFGRNFAGIIRLEAEAPKGATITVSHAEILDKNKDLYTVNLRTAKAQLVYVSKGGRQVYEPRFTYMGFQYVKVQGIDESIIKSITAYELYSDCELTGSFTCSNKLINTLQENILTSQKANFVDIPTDCPQRDERIGWTGDIAMYSKTAVFNMDILRFMRKWLRDLKSEQSRNLGNIPFVVPSGNIFWMRMVTSPIWSDAALIVPWDVYFASGNLHVLREQYRSMKQWVKTFKRISTIGKLPFMKNYYVYDWFTFGDWVAPDCDMKEQTKRGKWLATAYFANSAALAAKTARLLGNTKDAEKFEKLHGRICNSFCKTFLDGNGQFKKGFQSVYAVALRFGILPPWAHDLVAEALEKDIVQNNDHLSTGFPGTPHIAFALADNCKEDTAFRLLMQESCPSWLYPIQCGATSIWERWDAILEDGSVNETPQAGKDNMVSLSHYAYGAIGEFLYSRVAGLEAVEAGYKRFVVAPLVGGGLTFAKSALESPYGRIRSEWSLDNGIFRLDVAVPANTAATVKMPDGQKYDVGSGEYHYTCNMGE